MLRLPDSGDEWGWDRRHRSSEVELPDSSLKVALFHPNWSSGTAAIRGTRILNHGRYYWEIKISQRIFGTSMMFGIGSKNTRLHAESFTNIIGEDKSGWALSHKGLIWHAGNWYHYTKPFVENEAVSIGILFDGLLGTLTFFKDGVNLGVAFRGLQGIREPLYPMVSSTAAKTEMTIITTRTHFCNLQERCRAEIVKRICDISDVEKLNLPQKIKHFLCEAVIVMNQNIHNNNNIHNNTKYSDILY